jgi:nucleoside-diphosphate-sugar epimerase
MPKKLLLTGGCGFIGSAVVRLLLRRTDLVIVNVDKLTYAASQEALEEARHHRRHARFHPDRRGRPCPPTARKTAASEGLRASTRTEPCRPRGVRLTPPSAAS